MRVCTGGVWSVLDLNRSKTSVDGRGGPIAVNISSKLVLLVLLSRVDLWARDRKRAGATRWSVCNSCTYFGAPRHPSSSLIADFSLFSSRQQSPSWLAAFPVLTAFPGPTYNSYRSLKLSALERLRADYARSQREKRINSSRDGQ
jgi:hypothetical protein